MRKAVILAAGRGTRMGKLTERVPKPLLPILGRPLLLHVLDRLQAAGISEVLVVTGYGATAVERALRGHPLVPQFVRQDPIDGTAHAAALAEEFVGQESFLLTFADILADPADYQRAMAALEEKVEAVVAVKWVVDPTQGAAVYEAEGRVVKIIEKPAPGTSTTHWNSAGIYCFRPSIFPELRRVPRSPRGEYELTSAVEQLVEAGKWVRPYVLQGIWLDVGRPEDIAVAEQLLVSSR